MPDYTTYVKKEIFNKLRSKLTLDDTPDVAQRLGLLGLIRPVVSIDALLRSNVISASGNVDVTAGTNFFTYFTVPLGKRYRLMGFYGEGGAAGNTITVFALYDGTNRIRLKSQAAIGDIYFMPTTEMWLDPAIQLQMYVTKVGVGGNTTAFGLFEQEDWY